MILVIHEYYKNCIVKDTDTNTIFPTMILIYYLYMFFIVTSIYLKSHALRWKIQMYLI